MKKYYFQHDFCAQNDPKLVNLMREMGMAGIGIYWCIIERLYQAGGKLPLEECNCIAFALHLECNCITSVITGFNLFENDGVMFWSNSALERMKMTENVSNARKNAAKKRWTDAIVKQMQCNCNPNADTLNIKDNILLSNDNRVKTPVLTDGNDAENVDFECFVKLYHQYCPGFPRVAKITDKRKTKIALRIREMGTVDVIETVFRKMGESKFLQGDNPRAWKASFDWIIENSNNWVKVYEGNYDNHDIPVSPKHQQSGDNVNEYWKK